MLGERPLDGELVVPVGKSLSFESLQMRLHPAASRIAKLAVETPALLIVFDVLRTPDADVAERAATVFGDHEPAWRLSVYHSVDIQIAAPSDVHFHPPGSIRLPARDRVTPMELLTKMVEHHVWLTGEMISCAARLSDDELDELIRLDVDEDQQTIRSLLSRLVGQMGMWNAALADRPYDWGVEEHESIESLRERLAVEGPTYLGHVREVVAQGRLDDTFVDALCEPAEVFTYGGMIAHVLTFAAHRRTLVALALDAHGVKDIGWGDPMRWVAQPRQ